MRLCPLSRKHPIKSETGLVNTEYKRYIARIPKTYAMHSTML